MIPSHPLLLPPTAWPPWQVVVTGEGSAEEKGELLRPLHALGPIQASTACALLTLWSFRQTCAAERSRAEQLG